MKIALVTWLDATRTDDAIDAHAKVGVRRETVGWLLRRDDMGIVMAFTRDNDESYERGFTIPYRYVQRVKILGEG